MIYTLAGCFALAVYIPYIMHHMIYIDPPREAHMFGCAGLANAIARFRLNVQQNRTMLLECLTKSCDVA